MFNKTSKRVGPLEQGPCSQHFIRSSPTWMGTSTAHCLAWNHACSRAACNGRPPQQHFLELLASNPQGARCKSTKMHENTNRVMQWRTSLPQPKTLWRLRSKPGRTSQRHSGYRWPWLEQSGCVSKVWMLEIWVVCFKKKTMFGGVSICFARALSGAFALCVLFFSVSARCLVINRRYQDDWTCAVLAQYGTVMAFFQPCGKTGEQQPNWKSPSSGHQAPKKDAKPAACRRATARLWQHSIILRLLSIV